MTINADRLPLGGAARRYSVGGSEYKVPVAEPSDEFPNNFVGNHAHTDRGWVVVPPTCGAPITPVCDPPTAKRGTTLLRNRGKTC